MKKLVLKLLILGGLSAFAGCAHTSCLTPEQAMSKTLEGDPQTVFDCWTDQEPDTYDRVWKCFVAGPDGIYRAKTVRRLNVCTP